MTVHIRGILVEQVTHFKYLGLLVDYKLTWHNHVDMVCAKIAPFIGVLSRLGRLVHPETGLKIYYAYVHSHLVYMNHIWSTAGVTKLKTLVTLQNKAMRRIFYRQYAEPNTHTSDIYKAREVLPIEKLAHYNTALAVFKMLNGLSKTDIELTTNSHHRYPTSSRNHLRLLQPSNNYGMSSIKYRGAKLFNELPDFIKSCQNIGAFKTQLKLHLLRL